jgi:hypothetical protein
MHYQYQMISMIDVQRTQKIFRSRRSAWSELRRRCLAAEKMAGDTPNVDSPSHHGPKHGRGEGGGPRPPLKRGRGVPPHSLPTTAKFLHSIFSMDFPATDYDSCRGVGEVNFLT